MKTVNCLTKVLWERNPVFEVCSPGRQLFALWLRVKRSLFSSRGSPPSLGSVQGSGRLNPLLFTFDTSIPDRTASPIIRRVGRARAECLPPLIRQTVLVWAYQPHRFDAEQTDRVLGLSRRSTSCHVRVWDFWRSLAYLCSDRTPANAVLTVESFSKNRLDQQIYIPLQLTLQSCSYMNQNSWCAWRQSAHQRASLCSCHRAHTHEIRTLVFHKFNTSSIKLKSDETLELLRIFHSFTCKSWTSRLDEPHAAMCNS